METDATTTVLKRVVFPDGGMYEAPTWIGLEDALMADKWMPSDPATFRKVMQHRAAVWSGWYMPLEAKSHMFFRGLEAAGMLRIVSNDEEVV